MLLLQIQVWIATKSVVDRELYDAMLFVITSGIQQIYLCISRKAIMITSVYWWKITSLRKTYIEKEKWIILRTLTLSAENIVADPVVQARWSATPRPIPLL